MSGIAMAKSTWMLWRAFGVPLWVITYTLLKDIFLYQHDGLSVCSFPQKRHIKRDDGKECLLEHQIIQRSF